MKIQEVASRIGAEVYIPAALDAEFLLDQDLVGVAPIQTAQTGFLCFLASPEYKKYLATTGASAVLVAEHTEAPVVQLVHADPYLAFAKASQLFEKKSDVQPGISPQAYVEESARIGQGTSIFPQVYIGKGARIAEDCVLYPGVFVGDGVVIGAGTVLHAQVAVYSGCEIGARCILHAGTVLGADGFGYAYTATETVKIPQLGRVVIEDDVEIGALSSVDRATMSETRIGTGTKIDSKVQVGHNVQIGKRCMLSALTGLAGSCQLEDGVIMGGHSGVANHVKIASGVRIGAMTGVIKSIAEKGDYHGYPAIPSKEWKKRQVWLSKLGAIYQAFKRAKK